MTPPERDHRFNMTLSADEAAMLDASARDAGLTQSDLVRSLIRQDCAARGLKGRAQEVDEVWRAFERAHLVFLERAATARQKGVFPRETGALLDCLSALKEVTDTRDITAYAAAYKRAISAFQQTPDPDTRRKEVDKAFDTLWSFFDNWLDELKSQKPGGGK
jgi:hypothetical protein